jgi:peptidoglycan-associated lipoprotein
MARKLIVNLALIPLIAIAVGCSKKTKTDAAVESTPSAQTEGTPQVESTPMNFDASGSDSGKIAGLSTVYFDYDKSTISSTAKTALHGNADWLKKNANTKIQIEGHCDARGSIEYNLALGERRANSVKSYLVSLGIPAARINTISYGKEKPIINAETEEAYSKNRRANFVPLQ